MSISNQLSSIIKYAMKRYLAALELARGGENAYRNGSGSLKQPAMEQVLCIGGEMYMK